MSHNAYRSYRPHFQGASITVQGLALIKEQRERTGSVFKVVPPEERVRPGDEFTTMQTLALLQMMNSTLARGVATNLASSQGIQARPGLADYCELGRRGLCERLSQYHELTHEGSKVAKAVLQRYCADIDVHICQLEQITGEGRDRRSFYRCSCGQWSRHLQGVGWITDARARNMFHEHWNPMARGVED